MIWSSSIQSQDSSERRRLFTSSIRASTPLAHRHRRSRYDTVQSQKAPVLQLSSFSIFLVSFPLDRIDSWIQQLHVVLWRSSRVAFFLSFWLNYRRVFPFCSSHFTHFMVLPVQLFTTFFFILIPFHFVFHYFDLYELLDCYRYDAAIFCMMNSWLFHINKMA